MWFLLSRPFALEGSRSSAKLKICGQIILKITVKGSSAVPSAEILEVFLTNSLDPHQTVLDQFSLPLYLH